MTAVVLGWLAACSDQEQRGARAPDGAEEPPEVPTTSDVGPGVGEGEIPVEGPVAVVLASWNDYGLGLEPYGSIDVVGYDDLPIHYVPTVPAAVDACVELKSEDATTISMTEALDDFHDVGPRVGEVMLALDGEPLDTLGGFSRFLEWPVGAAVSAGVDGSGEVPRFELTDFYEIDSAVGGLTYDILDDGSWEVWWTPTDEADQLVEMYASGRGVFNNIHCQLVDDGHHVFPVEDLVNLGDDPSFLILRSHRVLVELEGVTVVGAATSLQFAD